LPGAVYDLLQVLDLAEINVATTVQQMFAPTALTNAAVTLFTVPTNPATSILRKGIIRFTNVTAGAITVTAWAVPKGGANADSNAFVKGFSIAANSFTDVPVPLMLTGDFIQALASAGASITVSSIDGVIYS